MFYEKRGEKKHANGLLSLFSIRYQIRQSKPLSFIQIHACRFETIIQNPCSKGFGFCLKVISI